MEQYATCLARLEALGAQARHTKTGPVFGFTSNLDIVLKWDTARYNEILAAHLKEEPSSFPGDEMRTPADFARISAACMKQGKGGNFDITDGALCSFLRDAFDTELALGGTAAQGAAALGALGINVSVHISDDSEEVCRLLDYPSVGTVRGDRCVSMKEGASSQPPVCHFILQFRKGETIVAGGESFVIPASNRLILFYDTMQKDPPFSDAFFRYWEREDAHPSSVLLSGFDAVLSETVIDRKIRRMLLFIERIKAHTPKARIYFEGAYYMNPAVKQALTKALSPVADITGMNAEELEAEAARLGETGGTDTAQGVFRALDAFFKAYQCNGVLLHTADYSLYIGRALCGARIADGLAAGNLLAATRARCGRYGTAEDLAETLRCLSVGKEGMRMTQALTEAFHEKKDAGNAAWEEFAAVPALTMEYPAYTVGLGDTFTAGVHTCFL